MKSHGTLKAQTSQIQTRCSVAIKSQSRFEKQKRRGFHSIPCSGKTALVDLDSGRNFLFEDFLEIFQDLREKRWRSTPCLSNRSPVKMPKGASK